MIDKEEVIKAAGFVLPPAMSILSSFLMLKYDKPTSNKDIVHRMAAASVSSFTLGVFVCTYIYSSTSLFDIAGNMGAEFYGSRIAGIMTLFCSIVWFCGLFGWALYSGIVKWVRKNSGSVIERALNKASGNEKKSD